MNIQDQSRPFYNLSQSAIIQSPYSPHKQLPTFEANFSHGIDSVGRKSSMGLSTFQGHGSNGSAGFSQYLENKNQSPSNQHHNQYIDRISGPMSRSTIIQNKLLQNHSSKTQEGSNSNEKTFNKYMNIGTSKAALNKTQEQPQDSPSKETSSPTYQKKLSQNFSFQFSPRKVKASQEQQGSIRQFIVVEPKVVQEKNNLDSYKKVDLEDNLNSKRSPTSSQSSTFNFQTIPVTTLPKEESPNSSIDQNKVLRRKFSSGKLNANLKGLSQSPQSEASTNYFYTTNKKSDTAPTSKGSFITNPKKEDFITIKQLGKGKYGDVFLSQHKQSRIICALKVISKQTILEEDGGLNQFIREVTIQMYLCSNYVVELWGIFSDKENVYLVLEPALDGQLYKYMKQKGQLDEEETAELIRHLCLGVRYLQEEKIIHRDLKPQNILLHEGKIKICDFGWAVYNENSFRQTFCGTPLYLSPDVLKGEQYNDKVDNWAIGIITYEMLVGKIPFRITKEEEMEKILFEKIQFPDYLEISDVAKDFVLSLLDRNPDTRMDIEEILVHKFLSEK